MREAQLRFASSFIFSVFSGNHGNHFSLTEYPTGVLRTRYPLACIPFFRLEPLGLRVGCDLSLSLISNQLISQIHSSFSGITQNAESVCCCK